MNNYYLQLFLNICIMLYSLVFVVGIAKKWYVENQEADQKTRDLIVRLDRLLAPAIPRSLTKEEKWERYFASRQLIAA